MRFLPPLTIAVVLALASPASATLSGFNFFTSFNGFDPAIATGGLAKNVNEGLWVPNLQDEFTIVKNDTGSFFAGGIPGGIWVGSGCQDEFTIVGALPCSEVFRLNVDLQSETTTLLVALFDENEKATGLEFPALVGEMFERYFGTDGRFEFAVPGSFEADLQIATDFLGTSYFILGRWLADDPMAFDAWYRSQLDTAAMPEPSIALLVGLGVLGVGLVRRTNRAADS